MGGPLRCVVGRPVNRVSKDVCTCLPCLDCGEQIVWEIARRAGRRGGGIPLYCAACAHKRYKAAQRAGEERRRKERRRETRRDSYHRRKLAPEDVDRVTVLAYYQELSGLPRSWQGGTRAYYHPACVKRLGLACDGAIGRRPAGNADPQCEACGEPIAARP